MKAIKVSAFLLVTLLACRAKDSAGPEKACTGQQALSAEDLRGGSLPMKTVALTFDDGPGARTAELSSYLKSQGIRATFFVNGQNVTSPQQLQALVNDGHVVANHTQTHKSITGRSTGGARQSDAELLSEVGQTDAIIAPFVKSDRLMFRAPFGDFDAQAFASLEATPMKKYVGPIGWDVGDHMGPAQAADWDCWTPGADGVVLPPRACATLYLQEIDAVGHGIVLMHDPYFIDDDPQKGGTVDMVKLLVPELRAKGYTFANADEVPEIAALLPALPAATDAGADASSVTEDVSPTEPDDGTSGGNSEPCPPSPQTKRTNTGESGNLLTR